MDNFYDMIIIGGGVIGSAVARELARYQIKIAVLEKNLDVCYETSGRNSAVVHGGFAYDEGSLKARFCVEGNREMEAAAKELDFAFLRCGKVLVGNTPEDMEQLKKTMIQGEKNGSRGLRLVDEAELHRLVPAVVGKFAMFSPASGILDPFEFTVALAENACQNGVRYYFDHEVRAIERESGGYKITTRPEGAGETPSGPEGGEVFRCRWIVNAAGLNCGEISHMLGIKGYRVIGSKGDYLILDKKTGPLLPMPVYPVPSNTYMGIHVTNTTSGNVTVGPNAELVTDFAYYGVPRENMDYLAESASRLWPHIRKEDYIRNYSGILPKWVDENGKIQDFKIEIREELAPRAVNLVGMESPGLTSAIPIGRYVAGMILERESFPENKTFNPLRKGIPHFQNAGEQERQALIAADPDYGELICRCEQVTKAEILRAIRNPLGVSTLSGIKVRTRAMMGRCQGGYCQMRIAKLLQEERGLRKAEILHNRTGSRLFFGSIREEAGHENT
ncbi:MAG: NAD(P)/FAD-dependent oxidoreductase [Fusobacteriaceae bacterium]|jgi:glycerol-3-phosphate dehydrogenase|nr:NAD(P)/FAD-dependent oxidoreductase [Fusobacteriaceae bacterium]